MKKSIIILLLFLVGCTNVKENEYNRYITKIDNINEFSDMIDYKLDLYYFRHENTLIYQLVLDDVEVNMDNIEILIIHDHETNDIFPNIGIFDEKPSLNVDQTPKGINLVGYIEELSQEKVIFKIMVKYNDIINYHMIESEQL